MTAADRQRIREAIDARVRAERLRIVNAGDLDVCSGCGCDTDHRTRGCRTCGDRHRKWRYRENAEWRERVRARARQRWAEDPAYRERRKANEQRRRQRQLGEAAA